MGAGPGELDPIGGDYGPRSLRVLRPGGVLVSLLRNAPDGFADEAEKAGVRWERLLVEPDHHAMGEIAALAEEGRLRAEIDAVFPLEEAARAHERGESGHVTGKIVLTMVG